MSAGVAVRLRIQELTRESFKKAFQEALRLEGQARVVGAQLDEQVRHSGETAVKEILGWLGRM